MKPIKKRRKGNLQYTFSLDWIEDLVDIPVIGWLLYIIANIFILVLCLILLAVAICVVFAIFIMLYKIHPLLAIFVFFAVINICAYCASFVWGGRKPWFFVVSLLMSIIALLYCASVLL